MEARIISLTTNQVLLILLALWSVCFWISGWVANRKRKHNEDKIMETSKGSSKI